MLPIKGWKTDPALDVLGGIFSRGSVVLPSGIVGSSIMFMETKWPLQFVNLDFIYV